MNRTELEQQIRAEFRTQRYPGDDRLVQLEKGYDPTEFRLESDQVRKAFSKKHWNEVTRQLLIDLPYAPSFFLPDAYVYYLPALMLTTLDLSPETGYLRDNLIEKLTVHAGTQWSFSDCVQLLTFQQKRVISEYLKFVSQEQYGDHPFGAAQIAWERYWNQFS